MKKTEITKEQIGKNWDIFKKVHQTLMSVDKNVYFRVFPIYAKYFLDDEVFAIVFFKGSLVGDNQVDLGLKFNITPALKSLRDAKHMKDSCVNYSVLVDGKKFDKTELKKIVMLALKRKKVVYF
jgi:hypothetical protein